MSGENRTEAPTPKRIEKARSEGKLPIARELGGTLFFFTALLFAELLGAGAAVRFLSWARSLREVPLRLETGSQSPTSLLEPIAAGFRPFLPLLLLAVAAAAILPLLTAVLNRGWIFLPKKFLPDFSRIAPRFGNVFSIETLWKLAAAVFQTLGTVFIIVRHIRHSADFSSLLSSNTAEWPGLFKRELLPITFQFAVLFTLIAAADLIYHRWKYRYDLRMTLEEIKREAKEE